MGAYKERIAPLIREHEAQKRKLATNNDMRRLLERYTSLIDAEITAAMIAISYLFEPREMDEIVGRFTIVLSEIQRRILLQEILDQVDEIYPETLRSLDIGVDDILDEYEENNLEFLPQTIPVEYEERVRAGILEGLVSGLTATAIASELAEFGHMADRRADFIAHDQTGSLYNELCEKRQRNVGILHFIWVTMDDDRVRLEHALLHGRVFSWLFGANGLYPGLEYGCRCKARAKL